MGRNRNHRKPQISTIVNQDPIQPIQDDPGPPLSGQLDQPAQPVDADTSIDEVENNQSIKESVKVDPTQGRPNCEGCPSLVGNSCWLNPVPTQIENPTEYGCSHHPSFKEFVIFAARRKQNASVNPKGEYNCSCIMIGAVHHDPASTNLIRTSEGRTLVAKKNCPQCQGKGKLPETD